MLKKLLRGRKKAEGRRHRRYQVESDCAIETASGTYHGRLIDLSPIGAKLACEARIEIGEDVTFAQQGAAPINAQVVRNEDNTIALKFSMNPDSVSNTFKALTVPMLNPARQQTASDAAVTDDEAPSGPDHPVETAEDEL